MNLVFLASHREGWVARRQMILSAGHAWTISWVSRAAACWSRSPPGRSQWRRMADIVGFGPDEVYVAHATGGGHFESPTFALAGFSPGQSWVSDDLYPRAVGDVTGDHKADIVG